MRVKWHLFLLLLATALSAEFNTKVENTNFTISQASAVANSNKTYLYNYDRLRIRTDYVREQFFFTFIGDGVHYFGDEYIHSPDFVYVKNQEADVPFKTQTGYDSYGLGSAYAKLYRVYGGYEDNDNRVIVGLQNISMGVGRIWNPTNIFNAKNTYALEPDETYGIFGISYVRNISTTANLMFVASQREDSSLKYALKYKMFFDFADFGLNAVSSDDTKMVGYEIEGNLVQTGVEVRSEGAYLKSSINETLSTQKEKEFFQGIVGADYGFVNGVSLGFEALYSSQTFTSQEILSNLKSEILQNFVYSNFYTALTLSYAFNIYLDGSLTYIESFNDNNSRFVSPVLTYTLNDYNAFTLGAMLNDGAAQSEFGMLENRYYFRWSLSF